MAFANARPYRVAGRDSQMFLVPHVIAIMFVFAFLTIPIGLVRLARRIGAKSSAK
jgi:hypothetical protein